MAFPYVYRSARWFHSARPCKLDSRHHQEIQREVKITANKHLVVTRQKRHCECLGSEMRIDLCVGNIWLSCQRLFVWWSWSIYPRETQTWIPRSKEEPSRCEFHMSCTLCKFTRYVLLDSDQRHRKAIVKQRPLTLVHSDLGQTVSGLDLNRSLCIPDSYNWWRVGSTSIRTYIKHRICWWRISTQYQQMLHIKVTADKHLTGGD